MPPALLPPLMAFPTNFSSFSGSGSNIGSRAHPASSEPEPWSRHRSAQMQCTLPLFLPLLLVFLVFVCPGCFERSSLCAVVASCLISPRCTGTRLRAHWSISKGIPTALHLFPVATEKTNILRACPNCLARKERSLPTMSLSQRKSLPQGHNPCQTSTIQFRAMGRPCPRTVTEVSPLLSVFRSRQLHRCLREWLLSTQIGIILLVCPRNP